MEEKKEFTRVAVEKRTQKQIAILASVQGDFIFELVGSWAEEAWSKAKKAGMVTDAMLGHWVGAVVSSEQSAVISEQKAVISGQSSVISKQKAKGGKK